MQSTKIETAAALQALFGPARVAVVGASADATKTGGRPVAYLQKHGFPGKIWPINPKADKISGHEDVDACDRERADQKFHHPLMVDRVAAGIHVDRHEPAGRKGVEADVALGDHHEAAPALAAQPAWSTHATARYHLEAS